MSRSLTGYLDMSHDVARFENNLKTNLGHLYYAPDIGFELEYWLQPGIQFNTDAFNTWVINQAANQSLIVYNTSSVIQDYTLKVSYTVAGSDYENTFVREL